MAEPTVSIRVSMSTYLRLKKLAAEEDRTIRVVVDRAVSKAYGKTK